MAAAVRIVLEHFLHFVSGSGSALIRIIYRLFPHAGRKHYIRRIWSFHSYTCGSIKQSRGLGPSSDSVGTPVSVKAEVFNNLSSAVTPTGNVTFSSSGSGTFSPTNSCTLVSEQCTVNYTPTAAGFSPVIITASYPGDSASLASSATNSLSITGASTTGTSGQLRSQFHKHSRLVIFPVHRNSDWFFSNGNDYIFQFQRNRVIYSIHGVHSVSSGSLLCYLQGYNGRISHNHRNIQRRLEQLRKFGNIFNDCHDSHDYHYDDYLHH